MSDQHAPCATEYGLPHCRKLYLLEDISFRLAGTHGLLGTGMNHTLF